MANIVTSSPAALPSVARLKSSPATASTLYSTLYTAVKKSPPSVPRLIVKASLREANVATTAIAVAASAILASNALAIDIKLGGDNGELAFVPSEFSVASGEKINFSNNAGFPHNVVFDEDEIPAGVDASKISMSDEDLLNGPGETYSVTLTAKGTYSFYCAPHQGAGMVGKVTVK